MNAYGFAAGDRINFSDPMGLCPACGLDLGAGVFGPKGFSDYIWKQTIERLEERTTAAVIAFTSPMSIVGESSGVLGGIAAGFVERYGRPIAEAVENGVARLEFNIGKGTKMVLRGPETHPIRPGGEPVTHYNVEVHEQRAPGRFKKTENTHLDKNGRVIPPE